MDDEPFIGSTAIRRGIVTRHDLRTRFRRVFRDVYIGKDAPLTAAVKARAAWLSTGAPLAGLSAAAVFGTKWLDVDAPAEIVRADRHRQPGLVVHTYQLDEDELCPLRSMLVTTPARTAFDIARGRTVDEAVPLLDALFNASRLKPDDVVAVAERHPGARGVRRLHAALELVDGGAESPPESRLRMLFIAANIPRPQTQIRFPDLHIRVDMGWPEWKVAVEYDGIQHWTDSRQRSWDIERIALLEALGWTVIRVSAEMLSRPDSVIERVRTKLRAAGCPL